MFFTALKFQQVKNVKHRFDFSKLNNKKRPKLLTEFNVSEIR